ncbi:MAG: hypothetical protein LCH93_13815 [Proteobacteria bacterium]|nr:hypothetical protein [Pseudomonadota bacterium]
MAGDVERLWLEVALREGNNAGKDAIIRGILDVKNAAQEAAKASSDFAGVSSEAGKAGNTLKDVAKIAAGVFTGLKLTDVTRDMADFHKSTMNQVAGLVPLASRLRITTDELQALQGAAREANVTNEELTKTLFTFNQNVGQAGQGSKSQIEAFEKLGIKILDAKGQLRPMTELLTEAARSLLQVENTSTRAALAAQLLGEKGARLNPLLKELAMPIGDLVDRGKSFGQIVDKDVAEALDRAKNSGEAAEQQFRALYATVAAPIHASALEYIANLTSNLTKRIREARGESGGLLAQLDALFKSRTVTTMGGFRLSTDAERNEDELAALRKRLTDKETERQRNTSNPAYAGRMGTVDDEIAALKADIARRERAAVVLPQIAYDGDEEDARRGGPIPAGLSNIGPFKTGGTTSPPVRGGGSNRDRIGEAVEQLRGEVAAAQAAYDALGAGGKTPLEDLQREVELRKKIADEIAKLGKYDPRDPRVKEIEQLVRAHEELEVKLKKREEAMRNAVEIERRLGDGTAFLAAEQQKLNEALDTGRLSYEAYSAAMKDAQEKADDMARKARGTKGGIDAIFAGAEQAAEEWKKANSEFEVGKRLFGDLAQLGDQLASGAIDNVAKVEQAILQMLLRVGVAIAQSELMKFLNLGGSGGIGGGGGLIADLLGMGGGGITASSPMGIGDIISGAGGLEGGWMPGFAGGGDPPVDRPSVVGEVEPEVIVPKTPSTVLNRAQLAALGVGDGGGGGTPVNVYQTIQLGSVVSRAEMERELARVERSARDGAIAGVQELRSTSANFRRSMRR